MDEKTFFNEGNVTVTNSRFIVPGQTYAMSGITSVSKWIQKPSLKWPLILILVGALFIIIPLFAGGGALWYLIGIVLIGIGIFLLIRNKPVYSVILSSASGEADAINSKDEDFIDRIVQALNDAIVVRG